MALEQESKVARERMGKRNLERGKREDVVAYDPHCHQDTIPRRRRSPYLRARIYLLIFISII